MLFTFNEQRSHSSVAALSAEEEHDTPQGQSEGWRFVQLGEEEQEEEKE